MVADEYTSNTPKSKFIAFYQPKKRLEIAKILINNELINCVEKNDFPGLFLHKHLNWECHVTKVPTKISETMGIKH